MTLYLDYETEIELDLDYETIIRDVINQTLDYEQCPYEVEVNVVLTDNEGIHEVNQEFREIDRPTDVLSFPMLEYDTPGDFQSIEQMLEENPESFFNPDTGELMLGDIMISVEKVMEQAAEYGHSTKRELAFLVAHSMMHLMGYDHETSEEAAQMEEKQNAVLNLLGITRES